MMYVTAAMLADKMDIDLTASKIDPKNTGKYRSVRLLLPGQTPLDNNSAYVADCRQLSILEHVRSSSLIICSAGESTAWDGSLLVSRKNLTDTFSDAARAFETFENFDTELRDQLLADLGLDSMLECCARYFKNMVQILDPAFNVIAGITPVLDPVSGEIASYQKDVSSFSASTLLEMSKSNLLQETYEFKTAQFHKSILFQYRSIIMNLYHHDQFLGKLLIIENATTMDQGSVDVADQIVNYFNYLMQKRTADFNISLHTAEYFISETLKGNINDTAFIKMQLATWGWDLYDQYIILTLNPRSQILTNFHLQGIRNHLNDVIAFQSNDCLVAVIRLSSADIDDVKKCVLEMLVESQLQGGISEVFDNFMLAKDHFVQARSALAAADQLNCPGLLHHYSEQAINHLYLLAAMDKQQGAFIHPAILTIVKYDQDNHTEYFKTLKVYFASSYNQVLTAKRLHIHRKSLQYRLSRLIKIANIDLDNHDEQIRLMLSIRFYENEG